jgi:hypothetical protein
MKSVRFEGVQVPTIREKDQRPVNGIAFETAIPNVIAK